LILLEYAVKIIVQLLPLTLMIERLLLDYGVMLHNGQMEFFLQLELMLPYRMNGILS
jgi:hypothetical protein